MLTRIMQSAAAHQDEVWSSSTSYIIAAVSFLTLENTAALLGVLLLVIRLIYDTVRLVRYIKNGGDKS